MKDGSKIKARPPRLASVFQSYDPPLYFVTFNTRDRRNILATDSVHEAFVRYAKRGLSDHGVAVGRYVIMPDHIHLFVRGGAHFELGTYIRGLKRPLSKAVQSDDVASQSIWQPGFFDHILRHSESYSEKWHYVVNNPVRAGLVESAEKWPYQGEITHIDRV